MEIIDAHAHMEQVPDPGAALFRAKQAGLTGIVAVGMDLKSNQDNLERYGKIRSGPGPRVYLAMGVHPDNAKKEDTEKNIRLMTENAACIVAVGEAGLDLGEKNAIYSELAAQKSCFERQIETAMLLKKPLIIHSRRAQKECLEMLENFGVEDAVFHWYSGPGDVLKKLLEAGYYISLTPALAYSEGQIQSAKNAPLERILVETDTPVRYRSAPKEYFESEPKDVVKVVERLVEIKGLPFEDIARITTENARKFFKL